MDLQIKVEPKYLIIYLTGPIDARTAREIEESLERIISYHQDKDIIINLTDVKYISSSGLRIFISLKNSLIESTQKLKLCNLAEPVIRVFEVTRVAELFDIFKTEAEALTEY
ncbi:MAG TPA: STAS domain-containing protein [Leptospiraceae bacterium]|nr:STAS domain-containing protein [Leptospiraceae bacterium]HMW05774.1 STAS domain-containing protein [Leptospiraceae bacterium]HMX32637.1 STAS domain-containing protein [Leptospiraceae bacterium]HMY33351.1 STAS domain-containing protein [Leptospiraceae bacterium]HMZ65424.1 STAS domain-containing protein [Leptospiraceae bacterium]